MPNSIPTNWMGYQPAFGKAYQEMGAYISDAGCSDCRTYLETQLLCPLIANQQYNIGFHISLGETSGYAVNQLGLYLSDTLVYTNNSLPGRLISGITPQIESNPNVMLNDTANWVEISGIYTATGGEQYITIGGFYPDSLMSTEFVGGPTYNASYYYIDSVFVIPLDNTTNCGSVGINEVNENNVAVYPNPASSALTLSLSANENIISVKVFNTMGQLCNVYLDKNVLDISKLSQGIYTAEIQTQNRLMNIRFVKE